MKLVRFIYAQETYYGVLQEGKVSVIEGDIFNDFVITDKCFQADEVQWLAPCIPTKAVCVGLNYYDHAREMNMSLPKYPLIFLKPSSSVNSHNGIIEYPTITNNLHYEAELAVVIGKRIKQAAPEEAKACILGYTCANDVTARDVQMRDGQWSRAKSCDTFLPLGPCIETELDPACIDIKLYLNQNLRQSSNTKNLIFKVPELISFISQAMTLFPGDVILTGTPSGVGEMKRGDRVAVEIEGIGILENVVQRI